VRWLVTAATIVVLLRSIGVAQNTYTYKRLHSFSGAPSDGAAPTSGVVLDAEGNLYGTTYYGGNPTNSGAVYKLSPDGSEQLLYSFSGPDGANPVASLLLANGNLYGSTILGGSENSGTVFQVSQGGTFSTIVSLNYAIGNPFASLIMDSESNLYGTGYLGFTAGAATAFELSLSGDATVLGSGGLSGLIMDESGNLYGTNAIGGQNQCVPNPEFSGCGYVFELNAGQSVLLHSFYGLTGVRDQGRPDGAFPFYGSLIRDASGNFYGTTFGGGFHNFGAVFELNSSGDETPLYSFKGGIDGSYPLYGLLRDAQGNLYGTTYQGGVSGNGTVFQVNTSLQETVLYSFTGGKGGAYPMCTLVRDAKGNFYGTTQAGGAFGLGTIFELQLDKQTN